jgi:sugar lactone lactonase YvrE
VKSWIVCRHAIVGVLLVCLSVDRSAAQQMTGFAAVDSATVARTAWARASTALPSNTTDVVRHEISRAATAWPTQPTYVWANAVFAARAGDTAVALAALQQYADLGLGRDLRAEKSFASFLNSHRMAAIVAEHDTNRASMPRSRPRATLPDSTFWPEGVDADQRTGRFYIASVAHRTIAEVSPNGAVRELWPRDRPDLGAILGVRVDAKRGVLYATTSGVAQAPGYNPRDSTVAALLRVRISDGVIERRWNVPVVPGGHTLGDLAVGPNGDVYVTDSNEPVLYELRSGSDSLVAFRHPLFHSLQGLAPTPDGRVLYLSDYSHGLLRVDLATHAVTRIDDAPHSTSLGCDGIRLDRNAIIAVQNGVSPARIVRFALDRAGTKITSVTVLDRNLPVADEPTIGTLIDGMFVYVANSQWDKHDAKGVRIGTIPLTAPILLAVPLPR